MRIYDAVIILIKRMAILIAAFLCTFSYGQDIVIAKRQLLGEGEKRSAVEIFAQSENMLDIFGLKELEEFQDRITQYLPFAFVDNLIQPVNLSDKRIRFWPDWKVLKNISNYAIVYYLHKVEIEDTIQIGGRIKVFYLDPIADLKWILISSCEASNVNNYELAKTLSQKLCNSMNVQMNDKDSENSTEFIKIKEIPVIKEQIHYEIHSKNKVLAWGNLKVCNSFEVFKLNIPIEPYQLSDLILYLETTDALTFTQADKVARLRTNGVYLEVKIRSDLLKLTRQKTIPRHDAQKIFEILRDQIATGHQVCFADQKTFLSLFEALDKPSGDVVQYCEHFEYQSYYIHCKYENFRR